MNLFASFAGAALVAAGFTFSVFSAHAQEYVLKFQSSDPAGTPTFQIQNEWAKTIEGLTNGRVTMEMLPVKSVVEYSETLDAVAAGILDGHVTDMSYWAGKDPAFALLGNPVGAWASPNQMLTFMHYGGGIELANEILEPYGVHMFGVVAPGLESFVSKVPLNGVDDLEGLKMRAPEGLVQEIFAAAGAAPVNLPFSEVFTSLDKGVIDAADATVFAGNQEAGLNDVAPHPVYPGFHSLPTIEVSMNKATWDSMPADLQAILKVAARDLAFRELAELAMKDQQAVKTALQNPDVQIHNWSAEERAKFRQIAINQWTKVAERSENAQKVYDTLVAHLSAQGLLGE